MSLKKSLLLSLLILVAPLNQAEELKLGSPYFPPYVYFDIDGELAGLWMTQLTPVLESAGITYNAVHIPIKRFYSSAATGKIDLFAMPKGRAGLENVLFSQQPFSHFDLRAFWLDGKQGITSTAELAEQKVALIKGYTYGGVLQNDLTAEARTNFVIADNQNTALQMLINHEVDYVLGYWAIMTHLQESYPNMQINNMKIAELPIYLAIHKNVAGAEELMQRFDAAMQ